MALQHFHAALLIEQSLSPQKNKPPDAEYNLARVRKVEAHSPVNEANHSPSHAAPGPFNE